MTGDHGRSPLWKSMLFGSTPDFQTRAGLGTCQHRDTLTPVRPKSRGYRPSPKGGLKHPKGALKARHPRWAACSISPLMPTASGCFARPARSRYDGRPWQVSSTTNRQETKHKLTGNYGRSPQTMRQFFNAGRVNRNQPRVPAIAGLFPCGGWPAPRARFLPASWKCFL